MILPLQLLIEPRQRSVRILHILLRLLPHIEDRAILTCTQHVLEVDTIPEISPGKHCEIQRSIQVVEH